MEEKWSETILGHPALWQENSDSRHFWSSSVRAGVTVQVVGLNVVHEIKGRRRKKRLSFGFESPLPGLTLISALWLFYFYISLHACAATLPDSSADNTNHFWLLLQLIKEQQRMTATYCAPLSCLLLPFFQRSQQRSVLWSLHLHHFIINRCIFVLNCFACPPAWMVKLTT